MRGEILVSTEEWGYIGKSCQNLFASLYGRRRKFHNNFKVSKVVKTMIENQGRKNKSVSIYILNPKYSIFNSVLSLITGIFLILFINCAGGSVKDTIETNICLRGNCQNGFGVQEFYKSNKVIARYEGNFKNSKYDGEGFFLFENGDKYRGSFKDDMITGKGEYSYFESGDIYKGEFKDDLMDGKGVYTTKKGNRYEGMFRKGKLFGEGRLIRSDGEIFIGNFKDDLPLGKAVIKNKAGKIIFDGEFIEK